MNKGNLIQNGVHMQDHEFQTVKLLLAQGYNIELIPPSQIKGLRMPDIIMNGMRWEIKAPQGNGKYTVQNTIQNAARQSCNIIIDLHRCRIPEEKAIRDFINEYTKSRYVRRMKIIRKNNEILDFCK